MKEHIQFLQSIKKEIKDQGKKQREVAEGIEKTESQMSLYLSGKKDISLSTLFKIFKVLGIRIQMFKK